jgi:hypothetical protein
LGGFVDAEDEGCCCGSHCGGRACDGGEGEFTHLEYVRKKKKKRNEWTRQQHLFLLSPL